MTTERGEAQYNLLISSNGDKRLTSDSKSFHSWSDKTSSNIRFSIRY